MQRSGCKTCVGLAGSPLELVQPDTLRWKVMEPVLLLGKHRFEAVDIRIRVKGGGNVSQIYGELPQCTVSPSAAGLTLYNGQVAGLTLYNGQVLHLGAHLLLGAYRLACPLSVSMKAAP